MSIGLPFPPAPKARASYRARTVYAIDGGDSYIYYGQVACDESVGFFKYRSHELASPEDVLAADFMSRFYVGCIGEALREGDWFKMGLHTLREELKGVQLAVQWPVGTLKVTVWQGNSVIKNTLVHDPEIQDLEIMGVFSASYHVPKRLRADFIGGFDTWPASGPIWRERVKKEEGARNHPDKPWCLLPPDWVPVERPT